MADQKPPRLVADERATVLALLQYQRDSLVRKVSGLDDAQATQQIVDSGTTLLWLMKHMVRAEVVWVLRRFAGEDVAVPDDSVASADTLSTAIEEYRTTWTLVNAVVAAAPSLDQPCRETGDESPVNLRWVLMHLLEETARHAGHADILRELTDGDIGR